MHLRMIKFLSVLFLIFVGNIFPSGVYEGKMNSQSFFFKVYLEDDLVLLNYLNEKGKSEILEGSIIQDSIFFSSFDFNKEKYEFKISVKNEVISLYSYSKNHQTKVTRLSLNTDIELNKIPKFINQGLDIDLIGSWIYIHLINPEGEIERDEFSGNGYIVIYQQNGNYIFDPRAIRNSLNSAGIREFSYEDLPHVKWKTNNGQLFFDSSQGTSISNYLIRNDTLFSTSAQGYTEILIRKSN